MNNKKLYYHRTDGGAEYLTDKYLVCPDGSREGVFEGATIILRIDGNIREDAEVIVNSFDAMTVNEKLREALWAIVHPDNERVVAFDSQREYYFARIEGGELEAARAALSLADAIA